jgi:hypothetical protein
MIGVLVRCAFLLFAGLALPAFAQAQSAGREAELISCDQFLENVHPDAQGTCHLPKQKLTELKFKSRLHELSFFWGFAAPGYLYCDRLMFRLLGKAGTAGPYDILWGYVERRLGHPLDRLGNSRIDPYIWAKWSGQYAADWFRERKGTRHYCAKLIKFLGPSGKVARWLGRY